jgi:membrane dipeptidase
MRGRGFWLTGLLLVAVGMTQVRSAQIDDDATLRERARAIHSRVVTLDTHIDIPVDFGSPTVDPGVRGDSQFDLLKMAEGGLDAAFFIVYVPQTSRTDAGYAGARTDALRKFDGIAGMTRRYSERIGLACRSADVETIRASGRLAAMIGVENGYSIGRDLALLQTYHDRCARYFGLVHNGHNDIADSASPNQALDDPQEAHGGLSAFGEEVVQELNRLGIMVDVSHGSKKTMLHAIRISRAPVIASHSGAAALTPHRRNLDDEQLLALKTNGGVAQVVAVSDFLKMPSADSAGTARPRAGVVDLVNHIDHIVKVAGIDHVGIASDFDGGGGIDGWEDASETMNVTLELVRRGYSETDIARIWSGNLLRVWREVEAAAERSQGAATAARRAPA